MFRQMNMMRLKSPKRNNNVNDPEKCINCGAIGMIVEDGGFRICRNCGAENPGLVVNEQGIKNEKQNGNGVDASIFSWTFYSKNK